MAEYLTRPEAAEYLKARGLIVSKSTLQKWATIGGGPIYRRFGIRTVYRPADLDSWANSKLSAPRSSTTELTAA
jgi:Helix-turn-helix domain